jgi:probable F420-dependent oxidoreductase
MFDRLSEMERPMKIAISCVITEQTAGPAVVAKAAEAMGFEGLFLPEHPVIPVVHRTRYPDPNSDGEIPEFYSHMPDPFVLLAMAAQATTHFKLATAICLVPERNPILLAKEVATLDHFSNGQLVFGIGAGWLADETEIMGGNFARRWPMTREYVRAMKELWTRPQAAFEGEFIRFPAVKSYPKPAQKPHPPIHIGSNVTAASCERALKNVIAIGDGWMPYGISPDRLARELETLKRLCAEAGRDFDAIEITAYPPPNQLAKCGGDHRRMIEDYSAARAHRLVLGPATLEPAKVEQALENLARKVLV